MWYQKPASPVATHRALWTRAFGAEPGRERPAEMAGAAQIALPRRGQVEHAAHPHAGVPSVDDDNNGIVGNVAGEFMTQPLRPDRHRVRCERRLIFLLPLAANRLRFGDPVFAFGGAGTINLRQHAGKCHFGVAVDSGEQRIIAAERFGLDVDLNRRRADLRHRPEMGRHAASLGADEADDLRHRRRGWRSRRETGADDAYRQADDCPGSILAVERGGNRNLQRLGERNEFGSRAGSAHPTAGNDYRPLGVLQDLLRRAHDFCIGSGTKGRRAGKLRLDQRLHVRFLGIDLLHCREIVGAPDLDSRSPPRGRPGAPCPESARHHRRSR